MSSGSKYDHTVQQPFNDPIVRCTECQRIIYRPEVKEYGGCPKCGNRRVRNVLVLSETEMADLKNANVDPEFIALFEARV